MATPRERHQGHPRARHVRRPRGRLRYQRLTAALTALGVTLVAVLGGVGLLPAADQAPRLVANTASVTDGVQAVLSAASTGRTATTDDAKFARSDETRDQLADAALQVPPDSGEGRRVVFDQGAQRVWLVGDDGTVRRTYLVSGSAEDNLDPGSYEVYSRSERAWGIDDSGTMKFMVRFAHGERAAIGFHDIPYKDGDLVQTRAELGTPLSSGCVRQWRPDAKALWAFAPVGTPVVVVA